MRVLQYLKKSFVVICVIIVYVLLIFLINNLSTFACYPAFLELLQLTLRRLGIFLPAYIV